MKLGYMALDTTGRLGTIHLGNIKYPRKELLHKSGYKKAVPIYRDTADGKSKQVGWKIGPHWFHVFEVHNAF